LIGVSVLKINSAVVKSGQAFVQSDLVFDINQDGVQLIVVGFDSVKSLLDFGTVAGRRRKVDLDFTRAKFFGWMKCHAI